MPKTTQRSPLDALKQKLDNFTAELGQQDSTIVRNAQLQESANKAFYKGFELSLTRYSASSVKQVQQLAKRSNFGASAMQGSLKEQSTASANAVYNFTSKILASSQYKKIDQSYKQSLDTRNANNHLAALNAIASIAFVAVYVGQIKDQVGLKEVGSCKSLEANFAADDNPFIANAKLNMLHSNALRDVIEQTTTIPTLYQSEKLKSLPAFEQEVVNNSFKVKGLVDDAKHFLTLAKDISQAYALEQKDQTQQAQQRQESLASLDEEASLGDPEGNGLGNKNVIIFAQVRNTARGKK